MLRNICIQEITTSSTTRVQ